MRPIFILLMCLIPTIAAILDSGAPVGYIDPELQPFVDNFETYGQDYMGANFNIPVITMTIEPVDAVNFSNDYNVVAVCSVSFSGVNRIIVGDKIWPLLDDITKEQVIFHELGHCVLYRPHLRGILPTGLPISIMYPYLTLTVEEYLDDKDYYMEELFSKGIQSLDEYLLGN
jgi:hypothetical protein